MIIKNKKKKLINGRVRGKNDSKSKNKKIYQKEENKKIITSTRA